MTTPLCPYYGTCGGCSLQHVPYAQQVEQKKKALCKMTGLSEVRVFSGEPYHYRNRLDVLFYPGGVGLRRKNNGAILPIARCVIATEGVNELLQEVSQFFPHPPSSFLGAILRQTSFGKGICFQLKDFSALKELQRFAAQSAAQQIVACEEKSEWKNEERGGEKRSSEEKSGDRKRIDETSEEESPLNPSSVILKGEGLLKEKFLGKEFFFPVEGFFQNNILLAEEMHRYCQQVLQHYPTQDAHLLDLYSGVGTFGILNAPLFRSVQIVESVPGAITAAQKNAQLNKVHNCSFHTFAAEKISRITFCSPLYIITDPPRSGMEERTLVQLKKLQPEVILYISCNPAQLAKDIPKLKRYRVKSAALFDFFPQTQHSEVVVELVKNA